MLISATINLQMPHEGFEAMKDSQFNTFDSPSNLFFQDNSK